MVVNRESNISIGKINVDTVDTLVVFRVQVTIDLTVTVSIPLIHTGQWRLRFPVGVLVGCREVRQACIFCTDRDDSRRGSGIVVSVGILLEASVIYMIPILLQLAVVAVVVPFLVPGVRHLHRTPVVQARPVMIQRHTGGELCQFLKGVPISYFLRHPSATKCVMDGHAVTSRTRHAVAFICITAV
uniref:Uncharacterized protein n=1 Tax=Octopus bimaculoides TaxID=37653 RepID=A0A0L8H6Q3_OCTBM